MESKRSMVGVSKALHFLVPDLIMPIDGKYTMVYFHGYNKTSNNIDVEFRNFMNILERTHRIVKKIGLTQKDISNEGWSTSMPKLVDNAIIGCLKCKNRVLI